MKITVLMENTAYAPEFIAEHGLSLYIETEKHKILFDTGASGAFVENAQKLGVNLDEVEFCVLSHGHYDHGGGLLRFFEVNDHAPVYVNENVFGDYYNTSGKYIGLDPALKGNPRLIAAGDDLVLDDELEIFTAAGKTYVEKLDSAGLTEQKDGVKLPDTFCHEQYLSITENGQKTVISGCSHRGILNIMAWTKPDILIGGFHFMKKEITEAGNADLDHAAQVLLTYNTHYYTCHCTGLAQYRYLKERMGSALDALSSGQQITI